MRRLVLLAIFLSVAGTFAAGATTQAKAGGNGASVFRASGECLVADSTGSWFFSCDIQIVLGPGGSVTQYIRGSVIPDGSSPLPSRAATDFVGWPCLVLDGQVITRAVAGVVTPSGQVQLTCRG
jgi:hypothetical protein